MDSRQRRLGIAPGRATDPILSSKPRARGHFLQRRLRFSLVKPLRTRDPRGTLAITFSENPLACAFSEQLGQIKAIVKLSAKLTSWGQ